jgi:hypothetical protein
MTSRLSNLNRAINPIALRHRYTHDIRIWNEAYEEVLDQKLALQQDVKIITAKLEAQTSARNSVHHQALLVALAQNVSTTWMAFDTAFMDLLEAEGPTSYLRQELHMFGVQQLRERMTRLSAAYLQTRSDMLGGRY